MKVALVGVYNRFKSPVVFEFVNPGLIVGLVPLKICKGECFVEGFKVSFAGGYCVLVDDVDKKKLVM